MSRVSRLHRRLTICILVVVPHHALAQSHCAAGAPPMVVGSAWESYARVLQLLGVVSKEPWTVRAFTPKQASRLAPADSSLPWINASKVTRRCFGAMSAALSSSKLGLIHNSAFPFGHNDGAVWAGRGLTGVTSAGAFANWGPITVTAIPIASLVQNSAFALTPNGRPGKAAFGDWRMPDHIDMPQRFGDATFAIVDPGQSSVQLDVAGVTVGISSANQVWGPATDHPVLLGNNSGGMPHVFLQSSTPVGLGWLGRVHGRVFYGRPSHSPYFSLADSSSGRLASGIVAVWQPVTRLELGGGRFFQVPRERLGLNAGDLKTPFGQLFNSATAVTGDQMASLFARLVLPGAGVEMYGEFGREDASYDTRELLFMLDHYSAYLLGFRKAWRRGEAVVVVGGEVLNTRITHLALSSGQEPWYIHHQIRQGFTHRGQALGSAAAYGGGGAVLRYERYDDRGRVRVSWDRLQLAERIDEQAPDLFRADVVHALSAHVLRFGERIDVEFGTAAVYEFNRHFRRDEFNLRTSVTLSGRSGILIP